MATTTSKVRSNLSFGVELEFVFYYQLPAGPEQSPRIIPAKKKTSALSACEDESLPPPLIAPPNLGKFSLRNWATAQITDAILAVPGAKVIVIDPDTASVGVRSSPTTINTDENIHLYPNQGWEVKEDISVHDFIPPPRRAGDNTGGAYHAIPFELASPALWDLPASYQHISSVIQSLRSRFRVRVNLHTGLHVHVGGGCEPHVDVTTKEPIVPLYNALTGGPIPEEELPLLRPRKHSLKTLKRAAALLWAADGVMGHVHPPERAVNRYARPVRHVSCLAHGVEHVTVRHNGGKGAGVGEWAAVTAATGVEKEERRISVLRNLPMEWRTRVREGGMVSEVLPRKGELLPARRAQKLDEEAWGRCAILPDMEKMKGVLARIERPTRTVARGVAQVMEARSRTKLARMFGVPREELYHADRRSNYNFKSYWESNVENYWPLLKKTVEFREATGSVDAEWVPLWAMICVSIFRFARRASEARLNSVMEKLEKAEAHAMLGKEHDYDLVSLLFDLGLVAEGLFLEKKLKGDPVRFWYPNRLEVQDG